MNYAIKNLRNLFQNDKIIALLSVVCVCASVIILHFAYGLYQNYHVLLQEEESDVTEICIEILDPEKVTQSALIQCMTDIPEKTKQDINQCIAYPDQLSVDFKEQSDRYIPVICFFSISDNRIAPDRYFRNIHINQGTFRGEYFTDADFQLEKKVALMDRSFFSAKGGSEEQIKNNIEQLQIEDPEAPEGYDISIHGVQYQVIGSIEGSFSAIVPLTSLDVNTSFHNMIEIDFGDDNKRDAVTRRMYTDIRDTFQKHFQNAVNVPDLDVPDINLQYFYKTIMIISVLIAFIAAFNFSQLYLYIIEKRRKQLAIMRICGATKARLAMLFLLECTMLLLPVYLSSFLVFRYLILPACVDSFPYMASSYSIRIYLTLFAIYFTASAFALIIMIARCLSSGSIISQQKGKK